MKELSFIYILGGVVTIVVASVVSNLLLDGLKKGNKKDICNYVEEKLFEAFKGEVNRRFDVIERWLLNISDKIDELKK